MKKYLWLLAFIIVLATNHAQTQNPTVFLDGIFGDWTPTMASWTDPANDASGLDLLSFQVSNDENNLYIRLELAQTISLNSGNNLYLEIDGDNNPQTGYAVNGIGAELGWKFGGRIGFFNQASGSSTIYHDDIGFAALPTVTSSVFEMAISRSAQPDGQNALFTSDTIKICFVDQSSGGDYMPDAGTVFTYIFDNQAQSSFIPVDPYKADSSHIRILAYNTLQDGITDNSRQASFQRILQFSNPDIVALNECWNSTYYQVKTLLDTWLPQPAGSGWNCWKLDGGNITCSRFPITQNWKILPDRRLTASYIDLPSWYQKDLLLTNAHFKCCDGDSIRQREADAYINFVKDAQTAGGVIDLPMGTPFILCGDLNLVGDTQQLKTLVYGDIVNTTQFGPGGLPDWGGQPFTDHIAYQSNAPIACTWDDAGSSYWPGRLDFVISSQNNLTLEKTYIINTGVMTPAQLTAYGLLANDSQTASDHFAKVSDFSIPLILSNHPVNIPDIGIKIYPNPAHKQLTIELPEKKSDTKSITVFDLLGQKIVEKKTFGSHTIVLNTSHWKQGIYQIQVQGIQNTYTSKIVIQR